MARKRFTGQFVFPVVALAFFALALHFLPSFAPPTLGEAELRALTEAQRKSYWRGHTTYDLIETCAWLALALSVMLLAVRLAGAFFFDLVFRVRKGREAPHFIRDIFALVAYVVLTALILKIQFPSLSLGALLSGSALLGIIVGLALQDTLGNLFAGVSLQADKPFEVGDVITVGAWTGVVESVTWRAVKVRTFSNQVVLVSNSALAKESIEVAPRATAAGQTCP
jgi:small-conductance mechanosensitive channel